MRKNIPKALLAFDCPYFRPRGYDFKKEFKHPDWATEKDVHRALLANGYDVRVLGIAEDISILLEEIEKNRPDIVFNLVEVFQKRPGFDKNVVSLLEMLEVPYTGASADDLFICNNKAFAKKVLHFHNINIPQFCVIYRNGDISFPAGLKGPFIVKPLSEEASRGISQASVVGDEKMLRKRVNYIHKKMGMDAIVEEYIEGREFYVAVLSGARKPRVFPTREIRFCNLPRYRPRIATFRAKWDAAYRKRWGIRNVSCGRLADGLAGKIEDVCIRAYSALGMHSYARFDIRVSADSTVYLIEANANPCLARYEDFSQAAEKAGIPYNRLIKDIINLARFSHR